MDSSYKNTTSEIRGSGIRALTLKEFLCSHEGNRGAHIHKHTHTQETPAVPTLTYYHIPYLDNPLSHRIQSARPITPLFTHMHMQTHRWETPNICVMLRLPSTSLGKVSNMRCSFLAVLPLTLVFHPFLIFVLLICFFGDIFL